jgi:hypothetical protein
MPGASLAACGAFRASGGIRSRARLLCHHATPVKAYGLKLWLTLSPTEAHLSELTELTP